MLRTLALALAAALGPALAHAQQFPSRPAGGADPQSPPQGAQGSLGDLLRQRIQQSGMTAEQIRARLGAMGYSENVIDQYLSPANRGQPAPAPTLEVLSAAAALGWSPVVVDDRPALLTFERFPQAAALVRTLDLDGVSRVLDVAGGTGVFAMAFARARPGLEAVVFDLPAIVPITRRYVEEAGLSDRVTAVAGDATADDLPGRFDLVLLSAILHSFAPDVNQRLVAKAAAALAPGGRVVVQEFVVNEDRTGPLQPTLFALNMLVGTQGGDTYTEGEIRGWMEAAGLTAVTRMDTEFGTGVVVGRNRP